MACEYIGIMGAMLPQAVSRDTSSAEAEAVAVREIIYLLLGL
jgi:hypothetical protein